MLKGLSSHPEKTNEFINGTLLDPISGNSGIMAISGISRLKRERDRKLVK
jgi:hypothetical protein